MDYTKSPLWFRARKVLRYVRLYGVSRTLAKVRGQYHMKAHYDKLPACREPESSTRHVGLIGCGNFPFGNIAYYLSKEVGPVIRGAMDIDPHRAASLAERYGADYHTTDAAKLLADPQIDLVYIASNHASHAEYAIAAIKAGKAVHIEKPHVVNEDQLKRLLAAVEEAERPRINLGFNRPLSPFGKRILETLEGQEGASVINWFVGGHEIDADHWYFHEAEGGRVLGNLCHWSDFTLRMVAAEGRYPIRIIPTRAAASDCDIAVTYVFGDGSIGAITFSAKGHAFEGVRERLNVHKGNVLISLSDFGELVIDDVETKKRYRPWLRQHGQRDAILRSYTMSTRGGNADGMDINYVRQTAELFLATRVALEDNQEVVLEAHSAAPRLTPSKV